ncbi:MAG: hypothetical protein IJ087_12390 [Eggerthellaceae bacterium]|nr:hypothetical protein [Eggerthellaceae bacterium]
MENLTIQTLNLMVRGFSNEVTVNWLASKLGVSYSTLARCKNGVWPRSVTRQAMRGVFDECRERFFGGDGNDLARCALEHLAREGVETGRFEAAFERGGYDGFVSELIDAAHDPGATRRQALDAVKSRDSAQGLDGGSESAGKGEVAAGRKAPLSDAVVALPVAAILLFGLLNVQLGALLSWAAGHMAAFAAALVAIAVLPVALGAAVDAPFAWRAYLRAHPGARFARRERLNVSKFGGADVVVSGAGRFDLSPRHCAYQALCNALGAMCVVSLLAYLAGLPGFLAFFGSHEWAEFFKVGIAVGFFVALGHNRELAALPPCGSVDWPGENPDNYLPSRFHVWANTAHLVVTFSFVCILAFALLAYSFANFRATAQSPIILWPFAQTMAFLAYSGASPYAARVEALGTGAIIPGAIASSVGVAALTIVCYLPSWGGAAVCAVCAATLSAALVWRQVRAGGRWASRSRRAGAYSMAVVASLAAMLAIGAVTSTLF